MRLSTFATTLCLSLFQVIPAVALTEMKAHRDVDQSLSLSSQVNEVIAQRSNAKRRSSGGNKAPARTPRRSNPSPSTPKTRSPRSTARPSRSSTPRQKAVSPAPSRAKRVKRTQSRTQSKPSTVKAIPQPTRRRVQKPLRSTTQKRVKQPVKQTKVTPKPQSKPANRKPIPRKTSKIKPTVPHTTPRKTSKVKPTVSKPRPRKTSKIKPTVSSPVSSPTPRRKKSQGQRPSVSRKARPSRSTQLKGIGGPLPTKTKSLKQTPVTRIRNRQENEKSYLKRLGGLHRVKAQPSYPIRRIVRKRRTVPVWGKRRVRSRPLTRSYRPCYYCPGQGWSYSPICNTRSRRYYVYSDYYSRLWPSITTTTSRKSYNHEERLAQQVERAIRDYAELYGLETLEDDIKITQEGSIIILSGVVDREETLEDLVAIARDIDGVRYVITEDVVVQEPLDPEAEELLLEPDLPVEATSEPSEPGLIFSTLANENNLLEEPQIP